MTQTWRHSALAARHLALGSKLEDWNGMGTAWTYAHDIAEDYSAIRTRAGLMDVSGLKKMHLVGPHASAVLDRATTRDTSKIQPGRSAYACMLNDAGKFIEDCILYRTGPDAWMVVHGAGSGYETLTELSGGRDVVMLFDDDLHDLSLQGPRAVDFLAEHVPGLRQLRYFAHLQTTLFDRPVMISRTGYTGERGYEIFCRSVDAPTIWDAIIDKGHEHGIIPCSFTTLDMLRVESSLMFYPYDNSEMYPYPLDPPGDTLWELGLDFTVSRGKTEFRGAAEHYRLKGHERVRMYGLLLDGIHAADAGAKVFEGSREVGVVTCGMVSPITGKSMALVRLAPELAKPGMRLDVQDSAGMTAAITHSLPFDDPAKSKRTAIG